MLLNSTSLLTGDSGKLVLKPKTPLVSTSSQVILNYGFALNQNEAIAERNYTSYDLYALKARISRFLAPTHPGLSVVLQPVEYDQMMRISVTLYDGSKLYPIDPVLQESLGRYIDDIGDNFMLILHGDHSIVHDGLCMPSYWLQSMIPFLEPDKDDYYYFESAIYADLSQYPDYEKHYHRILFKFLDTLRALYLKGSIVLHPVLDQKLIRNWSLGPVDRGSADRDPDTGTSTLANPTPAVPTIYQPTWSNVLIARNPTPFLYHIRSSNLISFDIGLNNVLRHEITSRLLTDKWGMNLDFYFEDHTVKVGISDLILASKVSKIICKARAQYSGVIKLGITPPDPDEENQVSYYDTELGKVYSVLYDV